ncbi:uncharacterized protein LOC130277156 [Hyla sarda]|uniref:uncharacterized protein LOC130277156 n=1 Tax=Hyla sarda TaxID=327740 RepID=UPI0024C34F99|nr:uncharacterized protein LOC130277156 [Hyla sarda]
MKNSFGFTPLWTNNKFKELVDCESTFWDSKGIKRLEQIFDNGQLFSFDHIKRVYDINDNDWLYYWQVSHAVHNTIDKEIYVTQKHNFIEALIQIEHLKKKGISILYKKLNKVIGIRGIDRIKEKWSRTVGTVSEDDWDTMGQNISKVSRNMEYKITQFKILHRTHYSALHLYRMVVKTTSQCVKCGLDEADYLHSFWSCEKISVFWESVIKEICIAGEKN